MLASVRIISSREEERDAENVVHGHNGSRETAFFPGFGSALVALHGIGVQVIAAEAVLCGRRSALMPWGTK